MENEISHVPTQDDYFNNPEYIVMKEREAYSHFGKAMLFQIILSPLVVFVCTFLFSLIFPFSNDIKIISMVTSFSILLSMLIANTVPYILCAKKLKMSIPAMFKSTGIKLIYIINAIIACLAVNFLSSLLSSALNLIFKQATQPSFDMGSSMLANVFLIIAVCIVAPITEEFIFRGVILNLCAKKSKMFAMIFSSVLFALIHGNLFQGIGAFAIGLVLAYITLESSSILPAIICHVANNSFALVASNFSDSIVLEIIIWLIIIIGIILVVKTVILHIKTTPPKVAHNGWKIAFTSWSIITAVSIYGLLCILTVSGFLSFSI